MNFDRHARTFFTISAVVYLVGLVLCSAAASTAFAFGFGAGGLVVLANALGLARRVKNADFAHKGIAVASVMGGFYVRLALVGLCIFALMKYFKVDPVGLVAGLSVVPAALFVMLILSYLGNRRPEEV